MHALGLEFGSAAQLSKRPGSVWNCLWGNALKRSPGIIRKSRVSYPGPGFLSSATWPSLPKKHYNGLNQTKPYVTYNIWDFIATMTALSSGFNKYFYSAATCKSEYASSWLLTPSHNTDRRLICHCALNQSWMPGRKTQLPHLIFWDRSNLQCRNNPKFTIEQVLWPPWNYHDKLYKWSAEWAAWKHMQCRKILKRYPCR